MTPRTGILTVLVVLWAALSPGAGASDARPALAPIPASERPKSSHAPFEAGDCKICHQSSDPKQPGPVTKKGTAACLECHEEFVGVMKQAHTHSPARRDCTNCHNPHNARQPKLLAAATKDLCLGCHDDMAEAIAKAPVPHKPVMTGAQCSSCHNPHASNVDKLLVKLPFDLCVNCHDTDGLTGAGGRKLQNIKAWLDGNKFWHGPIAKKDCIACHESHGGGRFRLLKESYPPDFYASYDPSRYALCFSCHKESAFSTAQTTTLTSFRDGATNLHYLHLQQGGRGRTCRACHEVHASGQPHHIRAGVPYGSGGWVLKLNFRKTETGGSCSKTCHQERNYSNRAAR